MIYLQNDKKRSDKKLYYSEKSIISHIFSNAIFHIFSQMKAFGRTIALSFLRIWDASSEVEGGVCGITLQVSEGKCLVKENVMILIAVFFRQGVLRSLAYNGFHSDRS